MTSDAEKVKQFTEETGTEIPKRPQLMDKNEVNFIVKMILDETMELLATVSDTNEAKLTMIKMICDSKDIPLSKNTDEALIAEQMDGIVDSYYYCLNACAKKGVNLSKIFDIVHESNMDKKIDGKFIKREDGKILKPPGWSERWDGSQIVNEIKRQIKEGGF